MCAKRLEINIDVLDRGGQRALPLTDLTPPELVAAILQEFREVETLGVESSDYGLIFADGGPLDANAEIGPQLEGKTPHLRMVERPLITPPGAHAVTDRLYLRDEAGGRVYRLGWLPAIVGRRDPALPSNQLVAADLEKVPGGLRVSRRHVRITQEGGQYWVEALSNNPASLRRSGNGVIAITRTRQPLGAGDVIYLNRSEIALRFIVKQAEDEGVNG